MLSTSSVNPQHPKATPKCWPPHTDIQAWRRCYRLYDPVPRKPVVDVPRQDPEVIVMITNPQIPPPRGMARSRTRKTHVKMNTSVHIHVEIPVQRHMRIHVRMPVCVYRMHLYCLCFLHVMRTHMLTHIHIPGCT